MKKTVIVAVIAGAVGFVAGNAFWYLASPLWIDVVVDEQVTEAQTEELISQGIFRDADAVHKGSGNAAIYRSASGERILRFTEFSGTNGPDLKVWLVEHPDPQNATDVEGGAWLSLGPLKGNIGDQTYAIPADVDLGTYGSVVVWCEQFSVMFAAATLE